jgi:Tol biopolymer transport system component
MAVPGGVYARLAVGVVLFSMSGCTMAGAAVRVDGVGQAGSERLAFLRGTIKTTPCGVIYTMNSNGSDQRRLMGMRRPVCFPSWSRHGKKISFVFAGSGKPGIYTINADGSHLRRLTAGRTDSYSTWSPDGDRLAFTRKFNLYVVNADGSRLTTLTHLTAAEGAVVTAPTWSPDGRRIAFQLQGGNPRVVVLALRGRTLTSLGAGGSPSWSPDGKKIVFEHNGRLELTSPDGSKARSLVPGDGPTWSPDGRKIAFWRRTTGAQSAVYVVNIDGSGERRITRGPYDTTPVWLPR